MQTLKKTATWGPPEEWNKLSAEELLSIENDEIEALRLEWFIQRFEALKTRIPALDALINKQDVTVIENINDIAPLLFTHKVYKSYPMALIEKKKFKLLTQWLDKLTTIDLSEVDVKGVKTIDAWLAKMNEAGMYIWHSTGTTGKLSFFPRSEVERPSVMDAVYKWVEASTGEDIRGTDIPLFFPSYRGGYQTAIRFLYDIGHDLAHGGEKFFTLFDVPASADFLSLAGRLRHAKATGSLKKMDMIKALVKSKGELIKLKKKMPIMMEAFMDKMVNEYSGEKVMIFATTPDLLRAAEAGLKAGNRKIFSEDSILMTGGGLKGYPAPENWPEVLKEFYGVKDYHVAYGMTECTSISPRCKNGHYHMLPQVIPIVLDVETGKPLPRKGVQTGRFGLFDLVAQTFWGGLLTGDKVTIHYEDCGCGWKGAYLEDNIRRYSELSEGGDDKISCSGSQEAYNEFVDFVAEGDI
jgi:hypothetical protein